MCEAPVKHGRCRLVAAVVVASVLCSLRELSRPFVSAPWGPVTQSHALAGRQSMPLVSSDIAKMGSVARRSASTSKMGIGAGAAGAVAAAVMMLALRSVCDFAKAVPLRGMRSRRPSAVLLPSIACGSAPLVPTVSSGSSSFFGTSMAGRLTSIAPARNRSGVSSMAMMFERFNEKAIKAVMMAQEESRRLGHNYVGTEMLLVGVVAENTGVTTKEALKKCGVNLKDTRKAVEEMVGRGNGMVSVEIPFTPAAKRALADGVEEARQLNSSAIDTAHILLALLKEQGGNAVQILERLGVDTSEVSSELRKELQEKDKSLVGVPSRGGSVASKMGSLEEYGRDLTKAAAEGTMDPLVGRSQEIERTIQILARRQKNNPVLIGEPGVGKTAIAEGLAQKIASGDAPELLLGKRIVQLDLALLLAGTRYRGEFEERLKNVLNEVLDSKHEIILMIDEIHTIVGAGGTGDGGAMDAGNIMKPALSRGDMQVIGATTIEEYRKYIEKDKALERRFQPVTVPEPSIDETKLILKGLAKKYGEHHKLRYTDEAIDACVKLSAQYITDRFLPDKAIDILDETGARVRLQQSSDLGEEAREVRADLRKVQMKKDEAVRNQDYEAAAELKAEESSLRAKIKQITWEKSEGESADPSIEAAPISQGGIKEVVVTESDVAQVLSKWTGVPVEKVSTDESARLVKLEDTLHNRVIGQEEAVTAVAKAVRRARAGLKNPNRPIASFIFCGPTGVGKTELCKALSAAYFGKEDSMIRLDMSEFMERHTVSKLIGSPPGYVGYDEESQLTDGIRRKPYSLVLFDEIEKAHPDVFNLMLQILEDGRLTDSKGRVVSFKNALIIMTSNVGSKAIEKGITGNSGIGFSGMEDLDDTEKSSYGRLKTVVFDELKGVFKPEFLNRLDEVIVFKSLTREEVGQIAELEFRKTFVRTKEKGITISLTETFKKKVVDEGFNPIYGARPLRRAIMRLLEDELAESFLRQPVVEGEYAIIDVDANGNTVILRDQPKETNDELGQGEPELTIAETTTA